MTAKAKSWLILSGGAVLCVVAAILVLVRFSGQILKAHIEKSLGENVKAGSVTISWGKVVIGDLTFLKDGRTVGTIRSVAIRADFMSILGDTIAISRVDVEEPYFKLLIDKKGKLILPIAMPLQRTGRDKGGKERGDPKTRKPMPVEIKSLVARGGKIDFEDRSVPRPVLLNFTDVNIDVHDIAYPFVNQWTAYEVTGRLAGGSQAGSVTGTGKTNSQNEETKVKTVLKNIDLTLIKPYIEIKGDAGIERGFIDMTMEAAIVKKHIRAPGTMVIRGLQLSSSGGVSETFLGVPRSLVLSFLKNNKNDISLDFVLEGNLDNPKFTIRENLATRVAVALATRFGFSIKGAGEALTGQGIGIIDEVTKTLKGIFKR